MAKKNHHYVPRVHIRHFKSESKYFKYLLGTKKIVKTGSSAGIFKKKHLNTAYNFKSNEIDSDFIENELDVNWDSKFNHHYDVIKKGLVDGLDHNDPNKFQETFKFFFEYGIVGLTRSLKTSKKFNDNSTEMLGEVPDAFAEIKEFIKIEGGFNEIENRNIDKYFEKAFLSWQKMLEHQSDLKYPCLTPTNAGMFVPESCSCDVYIAERPSFILPDCTAYIERSGVFFKHMGYPIEHVKSVGIPLDPYTLLRVKNNEVLTSEKSNWMLLSDIQVLNLNRSLFNSANAEFVFREGTPLDFIDVS